MNQALRSTTLCLFIGLLLFGCSKNEDFVGSNEIITISRSLADFKEIIAETDLKLIVSKGPSQSVEITVNENLENQLRTQVNNQTLRISLADGSYDAATFEVKVVIPELDRLVLNDNIDGSINFDQKALDIEINDSSELLLEGEAEVLNLANRDAGKILGFGFIADQLNINARDASLTEISCQDQLTGSVKQAATLRYRGFPTISASTSEDGKIVNAN